MKNIIIIPLIALSLQAQASFFQENCSNADQTISKSAGHMETKLTVTERSLSDNGNVDKKVELDMHDESLEISESDEKQIDFTGRQYCDDRRGSGYSTWSKVVARKLTIAKKDGSTFSDKIVGVSADKKSISTNLICQEDGNSQILCGPHVKP